MTETFPAAYIVKRVEYKQRRTPVVHLITVMCPYCGDQHTHGGGQDGTLLGHRVAHCRQPLVDTVRGYVLTDLPAGTGIPAAPALSCASCARVIGKTAGHFVDDQWRVLCSPCRNKPTQRAHAELYPDCCQAPYCRVRVHAKASCTRAGAAALLGLWPHPAPLSTVTPE